MRVHHLLPVYLKTGSCKCEQTPLKYNAFEVKGESNDISPCGVGKSSLDVTDIKWWTCMCEPILEAHQCSRFLNFFQWFKQISSKRRKSLPKRLQLQNEIKSSLLKVFESLTKATRFLFYPLCKELRSSCLNYKTFLWSNLGWDIVDLGPDPNWALPHCKAMHKSIHASISQSDANNHNNHKWQWHHEWHDLISGGLRLLIWQSKMVDDPEFVYTPSCHFHNTLWFPNFVSHWQSNHTENVSGGGMHRTHANYRSFTISDGHIRL